VAEYQDKLVSIKVVSNAGYLLVVSKKAYVEACESFGTDDEKVAKFIKKALPSLNGYSKNQINRVIRSFEEVHWSKGNPIIIEAEPLNYIYLIAEGEVRLQASHNPYTKVEYEQEYGCSDKSTVAAVINSNGYGNFSRTLGGNQIGIMTKG